MVSGKAEWLQVISGQETIEELASKLGTFTLILGLLLFLNFTIMLMIQKPKTKIVNSVITQAEN